MSEINIQGFVGANNVNERFFVKNGIVEPRLILNANVDLSGDITKREGQTLFLAMEGAHSLWAGTSCMLCAAKGILYRIRQGKAENVGTVSGDALNYAEVEGKVYISNRFWQGVFDPATNSVVSWGVTPPPGPMMLAGAGNLPAGTYHVTMTNVRSGELSGSGPIASIELTAEGGIQILNRPAGALVWATDADEGIFYLVGDTSQIVDIPTVEPLPSLMCSPPPYLENLCYAFGRIWGSSGSTVYYSEPFKPGLFNLNANKFDFDSEVTVIAKVPTGLFIGMEDRTRFLAGTKPEQMQQTDAGAGAVKGTLAYCNNLPELGDVLGTPEKGFVDVPVWVSLEGIVAGNQSGKLYNLTKNKVKMSIPDSGAALYRNMNGVFQYLTSFKMGKSGMGTVDEETRRAFQAGRIDTHTERKDGMSCRASFSDEATCKVYRDGVEI